MIKYNPYYLNKILVVFVINFWIVNILGLPFYLEFYSLGKKTWKNLEFEKLKKLGFEQISLKNLAFY